MRRQPDVIIVRCDACTMLYHRRLPATPWQTRPVSGASSTCIHCGSMHLDELGDNRPAMEAWKHAGAVSTEMIAVVRR